MADLTCGRTIHKIQGVGFAIGTSQTKQLSKNIALHRGVEDALRRANDRIHSSKCPKRCFVKSSGTEITGIQQIEFPNPSLGTITFECRIEITATVKCERINIVPVKTIRM